MHKRYKYLTLCEKLRKMKANELRLGNFVIDEDGDVLPITAITPTTVFHNGDLFSAINTIIGVPLTEGWLIKFGFEKYNNSNFSIDVGSYYSCNEIRNSKMKLKFTKAKNWRVENYANKTIKFNYVHQLQNLYFALTGKELEIKE